ncbi:MAG: enoyl-CoA hydratase/isomerase family protein [Polaromonas sp.]|uniref:enoyl-CoA hydratase/isomerase family protein n=1 Tax=Polaromonas sp. TaxID=1869339 RepID=UPI00272FDC41|nr:enoyl-CoA hydratase/isomerase family protein [Polaromonas sp.]MDP1739530.1 enoyl-CoA hydratase/isomerase family protein [Polaromonas sp.]MDP3354507.1 enoyl-CoA hydratase/isomerase family protein [Polaromonas sp.]
MNAITDSNSGASHSDVLTEVRGRVGFITLNRPKALNALSLQMVRDLSAALTAWQGDPAVLAVAIRGTNKVGRPGTPESLFGGFCAGGDIRFFHQAALAGDADLDAFFTEEYSLNHLIHNYPKPYIAFMDGVVMGGGMGLSQGARVRIVTEHSKLAMPETNIGLFPDVGGGHFLSRCPGSVGEYLALTGVVISGEEALAYGLADVLRPAASLPSLWQQLGDQSFASGADAAQWVATNLIADHAIPERATGQLDAFFSLARVKHMVDALEATTDNEWAQKTAAVLRKRSPLMLHVTLEQIRRARTMSLADDLRMERDMVHHCFYLKPGAASETVEGIRALAVDKDYAPKWSPARIEDVKPQMVQAFFASPWAADAHPLRALT